MAPPSRPAAHTLKAMSDKNGVLFYGFRVCTAFSESPTAGSAEFSFTPRKFKDVNGNLVGPARGFRLTLEMLRRDADSALIWYENFQDCNKMAVCSNRGADRQNF